MEDASLLPVLEKEKERKAGCKVDPNRVSPTGTGRESALGRGVG